MERDVRIQLVGLALDFKFWVLWLCWLVET